MRRGCPRCSTAAKRLRYCSFLLLIPAHASCLEEAYKLAFGVQTVWTVIFAFKFLEFYAFLPYLLVFYACRARPRAYLTQH